MPTTRTCRALSTSALLTSAAVALAITALTAAPALADGSGSSGHSVLRGQLVGSNPAPASPVIAGIKPGGAPWVTGRTEVRVGEDGRTEVEINGLVIPPPRGTGVNPIAQVVATLVCNQTVGSSTAAFALSPAGDGSTNDMIAVPSRCADPTVLIQPAANRTVYIASAVNGDESEG